MVAGLGVLGGTFDPVHIGHLTIAEEARWALGLDSLLLIPAAQQPHKRDGHAATPAQRLEMLRLACADNPHLQVSDLELRRPPPSYTVDTLRALRQQLGPATPLYFVLGADALSDLPAWREAATILHLARLVVIERPGVRLDLSRVFAQLPALEANLVHVPGPYLEIASSELRTRIAEGRPTRYLIPEPVRAYIEAHGLYREQRSGSGTE